MSEQFDAVVVGAGPNGLAAAVAMARLGRRVMVVEGADVIGGGSRTKQLTLPGFHHDVCAAVHPLGAASPFFRKLPLANYGLRWIHAPVAAAHPLEDETALLQRSIDDTATGLGEDGAEYRALVTPLASRLDAILDSVLGPPAGFARHPVAMTRFGLSAIRSSTALGRRFTTVKARALWAGLAAHSIARLDAPLTSGVGLTLALACHGFGFPFAEGGSQRIVDAMAAYLRDLGGTIETGLPVGSLSDLPAARSYLLDVSPRAALDIAAKELKPGVRTFLRRWKHSTGVFKVDYALSGPVPWRDADLARAGTVHIGGTASEVAAAEGAVAAGAHPQRPFVLVAQPSIVDPTRAPEGKAVLWAYCHVPAGSTIDMTEAIDAQIERFAPGFRARVLARHTMSPSDYEEYNPNFVAGDIAGGDFSAFQTFARPIPTLRPYRIGERVYICSSSTPPGAGVHGMCGYHAARVAERSLG